MINPVYENHVIDDRLFPFFFFKNSTTTKSDVPNWHDNIEILFSISGGGIIKCGTDRYTLDAGDIFVINSQMLHNVQAATEFEYYCLIIDDSFCAENGIDSGSLDFQRKITDDGLSAVFLAVAAAVENREKHLPICRNAAVRYAVLGFLIMLCDRYLKNVGERLPADDNALKRIKGTMLYIRKNFLHTVTLDEIAQNAGVCKGHLAREFKKYTGITVFEYLNQLRCKEAQKRIIDGESVSSAALSCGFENLSYFSRTYKKYIGCLPSSTH